MENELILGRIRSRVRRVAEARERQHKSGRLRWLVEFLRRDVTAPLREGERLDLSDDVLAFLDTTYVGINRDLSSAELDDIQVATLAGLKSWLSADRQVWPLGRYSSVDISLGFDLSKGTPPLATAVHNGLVFRPWAPPKIIYSVPEEHLPDVKHAFFLAAAQEIVAAGDRLKRCFWCANFFVSVRRQRYCSKTCTQEAMDARKPGREKPPRYMRSQTAEQHTAPERSQHRETTARDPETAHQVRARGHRRVPSRADRATRRALPS